MSIVSIDEYYKLVMEKGTPHAKMLMLEESLISANIAKKLVEMSDPAEVQREIMCLLLTHRSMVLANHMMEMAEGHPIASEGPVVMPSSGS